MASHVHHRDPDTDQLIVELCREYAVRLSRGEAPTIAEYVQGFPQVAEEIQNLFPVLQTEVQRRVEG